MGAAIEYARENVRINAIAPGFIAGTGMNSEQKLAANPERTETKCGYAAMNRLGRLEEVAGLVLWLCSDQASFVTGVTIPVDGGARAGKWK